MAAFGDDDEDDFSTDTDVQLGLVDSKRNLLFQNHNYHLWDGGKIGGKASWLNPNAIPDLKCSLCHNNLKFLLQVNQFILKF